MATIAELKVIVDASQIDKAKESLKSFNDAADKVQTSSSKISSGMKDASGGSAEFSGAAEKLIARVKELEATVGMSKGGVLSYKATLLGVNDVVKPLASSFDSLTAAQKNNDAISKEVARSQALADTEKHKMLESLKEEIALYGKSRSEIQLYRAEQLGIIDSVRPLVEELNRLKEAKEGADKAGKSGGDGLTKKQQELELLRQEGQAIQENLNHLKNTNAIEADRKRIQAEFAANQAKYDSKQQEISELQGLKEGEKLLAQEKIKVARATEAEKAEFLKLRGEIDPTKKALEKYYAQLEKIQQLRSQKKKGGADLEELNQLEAVVNRNIKTLENYGATTGKTAKEIAFSMRGLPAQFTDIAVSLQGGQKPLTVFLQQGGQLKDMFGGIVPAIKAMGTYLLSLISPLNLAIAAVGLLAFTTYSGAQEVDNFRRSLILTGSSSRISTRQMSDGAREVARSYGTVGKASEVLGKVATTTKVNKDNIVAVTEATMRWADETGTAVDDVLSEFKRLSTESGIEELQSKYSFLTNEITRSASEARERGGALAEQAVLEKALADTLTETAARARASYSGVSVVYNNLLELWAKGYDRLKEGGRAFSDNASEAEFLANKIKSLEESNKALEVTLEYMPDRLKGLIPAFRALDVALAANQNELEKTRAGLVALGNEADRQAYKKYTDSILGLGDAFDKVKDPAFALEEQLAKTNKMITAIETSEQGNTEDLNKALVVRAKIERELYDLKKNSLSNKLVEDSEKTLRLASEQYNMVSKISSSQASLNRKKEEFLEIEEKVRDGVATTAEIQALHTKDEVLANYEKIVSLQKEHDLSIKANKEANKTAVVRDDAATRLLLSLREQEAALREQLVTEGKLGKQAQEQAKMDRMFQDLKLKQKEGVLTVEQQSLLSGEQEIRNQRTVLVDLEKQNKLKQDNIKLDAFRASLAEKLKEGDSRKTDLKSTLGVSDKEVSRIKERNDLLKEKNDLDAEAAKELREGGSAEIYEKQIKAYQDYYEERKRQTEDYYEFEDEAQQDWAKGISAGFANFIESQADMYSTMSELTQNTLGTLADGLSESLTQAILYGEDLQTSLQNLALTVTEQLLKGLIDVGLQFAINAAKEVVATKMVGVAKQAVITTTAAVGDAAAVSSAAVQATAGATAASGWSLAALAASIGSFGSAAAIGLAAVVGVMAAFGGFRKGGYTGNVGVDEVAGVVHGKEYVFDAAATSRIGISNLENLRSGKGISSQYSNGGGSTTIQSRGGSTINQTINVSGQVDNQTATQIARRTAKRQSIAEARLG